MTVAGLWRRGQEGWPRRFAIVQFPNPPLLVAIGGWCLARVTTGDLHDLARAVSIAGLVVFALLEAVDGDNWFRHLLGVVVLAAVVARLAGG